MTLDLVGTLGQKILTNSMNGIRSCSSASPFFTAATLSMKGLSGETGFRRGRKRGLDLNRPSFVSNISGGCSSSHLRRVEFILRQVAVSNGRHAHGRLILFESSMTGISSFTSALGFGAKWSVCMTTGSKAADSRGGFAPTAIAIVISDGRRLRKVGELGEN